MSLQTMTSSMISPLRLAGSRLTSTTAGRAIATNSVTNARALQEEEHEAVRQHLEAMGHHHLEYRQPMLFRSSPMNTQRVLQQDSQSGLHFQSIRSISTSQCLEASLMSQSVTAQEAGEDFDRLHREAMEHWFSVLQHMKGSLITTQGQNPQSQLDSQFQSVRSLHTNVKMPEFMDETSASEEIISLHNEAIERRQQQMQKIYQDRSSLITNQRPGQKQQPQFQSVRSLHTNVRIPEFVGEVPESQDILSLHSEAIKQRQQQMQELSQVRGSLITNKRPVQKQQPQFQSVRSLHTNVRIPEFVGEFPESQDILTLHSEAIEQRQQQMQELSQVRGSLITHKIDATQIKDSTAAFE